MQIIQNKKYKLSVDILMLDDSFFVAQKGILTVAYVTGGEVHFEYKVGATITKAKLPLTTFIHCVVPVEIGTEWVKPCTCGNRGYTALVKNIHLDSCPNYIPESKKEEPKGEWPKVGDEYWYIDVESDSNAKPETFTWNYDTYDVFHKNTLGIYRTEEKAQEALEKMKAIARELSGK